MYFILSCNMNLNSQTCAVLEYVSFLLNFQVILVLAEVPLNISVSTYANSNQIELFFKQYKRAFFPDFVPSLNVVFIICNLRPVCSMLSFQMDEIFMLVDLHICVCVQKQHIDVRGRKYFCDYEFESMLDFLLFGLSSIKPQNIFPQKVSLTKSPSLRIDGTMLYSIFVCNNSGGLNIGAF